MRGHISASRLLIGFCALLLAAASLDSGLAQEQQLMRYMSIQVHPGMAFEFENFLKTDLFPAMRKAGATQWGAWRGEFGEGGEYAFTAPVANLAELDKPNSLLKVLGPEGLNAMMGKMQKYMRNTHTYLVVMRPDLGIEPASGYVPKICMQVRITVATDRSTDYEKFAKAISGVIKKTNAKGVYAAQVLLGGNPAEYHSLNLLESYADLAAFASALSKGWNEANIPSMSGVVEKVEYRIYQYAQDLSQQAPAQ